MCKQARYWLTCIPSPRHLGSGVFSVFPHKLFQLLGFFYMCLSVFLCMCKCILQCKCRRRRQSIWVLGPALRSFWWQAPLLSEPSCWPQVVILVFSFLFWFQLFQTSFLVYLPTLEININTEGWSFSFRVITPHTYTLLLVNIILVYIIFLLGFFCRGWGQIVLFYSRLELALQE